MMFLLKWHLLMSSYLFSFSEGPPRDRSWSLWNCFVSYGLSKWSTGSPHSRCVYNNTINIIELLSHCVVLPLPSIKGNYYVLQVRLVKSPNKKVIVLLTLDCLCHQGCVWLRCYLPQKCAQHPDRLHSFPPHFRHGRSTTLQREVLLLHRPFQTQRQGVPVSQDTTLLSIVWMASLDEQGVVAKLKWAYLLLH